MEGCEKKLNDCVWTICDWAKEERSSLYGVISAETR